MGFFQVLMALCTPATSNSKSTISPLIDLCQSRLHFSVRSIGCGSRGGKLKKQSYLWRKYADYLYTKRERTILWDMIEPCRRPKSFTPLVTIYIAAFYIGVIGSAITEQLYKEIYREDHPGDHLS